MAEFITPDEGDNTLSTASGQVPEVSETTVVKGQYGLKQSWRTGQET